MVGLKAISIMATGFRGYEMCLGASLIWFFSAEGWGVAFLPGNAGYGLCGAAEKTTEAKIDCQFTTNLMGASVIS